MFLKQLSAKFFGLFTLAIFSIAFSTTPVFADTLINQTQESVQREAQTYGVPALYPDGLVTNFHSVINLDEKGNAQITESITVYFPKTRHGFFRWIPNEVRLENNKKLKQPIAVTTLYYQKLPTAGVTQTGEKVSAYSSSTSSGNYTVLKIGEADTIISGAYTYTISYTMKKAVRFQTGYQELYLNITGDQWEIPILKASAEIKPTTGSEETKCFTGSSGLLQAFCSVTVANTAFQFNTTAAPNLLAEGLTIAIKYADKTFLPPSKMEQLLAQFLPFTPLLLPLFAFMYGFSTWKKYGKNISLFAIPPIFLPTKEMETENLSIQASLLSMRTKGVSTLAELIRIAERGLLSISYVDGKVSLKLTPEQQVRLPEFLATQPQSLSTTIKTLTDNFSADTSISALMNVHTEMAQAKQKAAAEFKETVYITDKSESTQFIFVVWSIISFVGGFLFFFVFEKFLEEGWILLPISLIISGIIFAIFASGMLKRTKEGDSLYRDLLGLKKYIKAAEVKRLEFFNDPKKMIAHFEQILPYAVVLGLDRKWTKEFGPVLEQLNYQPTWMSSNVPLYNALPHVYAGMASQMNSSMMTISTPPQSSGSSFGGGGGFSGGGSGGGGGGSW